MSGLFVSGEDFEHALREAVERAGLPREALEIQEVSDIGEPIDDRAARMQQSVTLRVTVKADYVANLAREHISRLLDAMEVQAEIRTIVGPDIIKLKMRAPESAILIGRNGQTLEALQHLVNRMVCKSGLECPFVALDIEDYRERRLARLERLARHGAREALESGQEIELDPMPASDRKIVHMTLRSIPNIRTFSRGEEPERRVVIAAAEKRRP
ncbi:MAG: R3H domain protein [candidate division BRC1 bacterium ADurb.BinA364]|nr:MAG: R3H domain protein [candidate division BRC1 bacterium ADurb.BinA364]